MSVFEQICDRSLAHIVRFNTTPQHFQESVAAHSFFVAYVTSLLAKLLEERGEEIDHEKAVVMALVHDMDEVFSGDILSPFKHHSTEIFETIQQANNIAIHDVFNGLPEKMRDYYKALWKEEGERKTIEAQVVKTADRLALIAKCREEMKGGNEFFREIYERQYKKLEENDQLWWQLIKNDVLEI